MSNRVELTQALKPRAGVPFSEWSLYILSWSAGYWWGKAKTTSGKNRKRFQRWSNQAHAELLARKLRE